MEFVYSFVASVIFLALNIHVTRTGSNRYLFWHGIFFGICFATTVVNEWSLVLIPQVILVCCVFKIIRIQKHNIKLKLWTAGLVIVVGTYCAASIEALKELKNSLVMCWKYPLESMQKRVPEPRYTDEEGRLVALQSSMINELEKQMGGHSNDARADQLRRYHEEKLDRFSKSFGFGVNRGFPNSRYQEVSPERKVSDTTWRQGRPVDESSGESQNEISPSAALEELHRREVVDFSDPFDFGYIKDRLHVAGFRPHQIDKVPTNAEDWRVERLDLVGLLLHLDPVVYVTDILPQMDELRGAPTRPLDSFEEAGLARLNAGDDMYSKETSDGIRMLGAVRNMKQCVACHGGQRGDLLGAFSYVLRK